MIKCDITSQIVELSPGANTTVTLTVTNQSQVIDEFTVSIQPAPTPETIGLNQAWITLSPTQFSLRPTQQGRSPVAGENQQSVKIVITIPAQVEANNYAGVININARTGSTNSAQLPFNLIISEREEQKLEIQPQEQSSRRRTEIYRLTLINQGNSPHLYSAYGEDDEDKCLFDVIPTEVTLQPGEQAAFTLKVRPRQRNWIDSDRRFPFKVRLEGFSQEVSGAFVQQCALPPLRWLQQHWFRIAFAIGLLCVLLIAAVLFLFPVLWPNSEAPGCAAISQRAVEITSNNSITEIHVSGPGGTELRPVEFTEQSALMPGLFSSLVSVSPDGRRLAYVTAQNLNMDNAHIIVVDLMNMDINKNPVRIKDIPVPSGLWPTAPVWSSAGDKIAFVKRPISGTVASATTTTAPSDTASGTASPGISGTTTPTTTATPTVSTITPGTPGANVAVGGQLELWVVDLTKEIPQKALALPSRLKADLFYGTGNRDRTAPVLCWADDDQGVLIRPQLGDKTAAGQQTQTLIPLDTSSKVREVNLTPQTPLWPVTPKTIFPQQPGAMIMPINMLVPPVAQAQSGTPGTTRSATATQNTNCTITRFFSQNDPRWANMTLSPSNASKLGEWGCPITGAAMLLNYQGVETTPADLNTCLAGLSLTVPLNEGGWTAVGQQCGNFKLLNGVRGDFSWDKLDSALQNGPAIVGLLGGPSGLHFVVVTSGQDGDSSTYDVVDPWDGSSGKTLADFISWGYRPRWLVSYDAGIGTACNGLGVNAKAANATEVGPEKSGTGKPTPATPIDITTEGVDDGGMYQDPVNFHYSISGVPTATATIFFTPKNGGPDQVLLNPLPGDVQQLRDEGNYAIDIIVRGANNEIVAGKFLYFTIDRTPPDITPLVNSTNPLQQTATTNNKTVRLQFNTKDGLSGIALVQYQINGGAWQTYNSDTVSAPPTFDSAGAYVVRYFAQDGAGNQSPSAFINFNIIGANGVLTPTNPTLPPVVTPGAGGATTPSPATGGGTPRTLPPVQAQGGGVPTVTPLSTATPRPPVKATVTPTVTVGSITPTLSIITTTVTPVGTITPFPTVTPLTTSTVGPTLAPTPTPTPTPTPAPSAKIVLSANPVTINSSGTAVSLQLTNSGNAATNWTLTPGNSSSLINYSLLEGTLNANGGSVTIQISRVNPNLTGTDISTSFTINSDGSTQTVTVIIQPTPTPTASFVPITVSSLDISQTVQLSVVTNNSNLIADHAVITATYATCPDSSNCQATAIPNPIGRVTGPGWNLVWNTNDVMPQDNISLSGVLCTTSDDSQCVPITPLSGLKIQMGASINFPTLNTEINSSTVISVTPNGRTALVKLSYFTGQTGSQETAIAPVSQADSSNNWQINWNADSITPETSNASNAITLTATACNNADTPSCWVVATVPGLHTDMHGTVTTDPVIANTSTLSGILSITATVSSTNVQHLTLLGTYRESGDVTATVHTMASLALDGNRQANYLWDISRLPAQNGIVLQVQGCFSFDDSICTDFANYSSLQILPGAVTTLQWDNVNQAAVINTTYASPIRVKANDVNGNPVSGVEVTFQAPTDLATEASGTFTTTSNTASTTYITTTDSTGTATSAPFTANGVIGSFNMTATAGALTAPIALTNNPPYQYSLAINDGDLQAVPIQTAFPITLSVKITLPNVAVTFSAPNSDSVPSGRFGNNLHSITITSTGSGIVSAPSLLTANTVVGNVAVQVTADGFNPAYFALANRKGSPANIMLSNPGNPAAKILNVFVPPGATPFQAIVTDAGGNRVDSGVSITFQAPVSGPSGTFTQSLGTNPAASISGTATTDVNGVATMPPFFANYQASPTPYPVKAYWYGSTTVTSSNSFNMVNQVGNPFSLTVQSLLPQPIQLKTTQTYTPTLSATVFDAGHNLVSGALVTFTVIPNSGAGGTFTGNVSSVNATSDGSGVASVTGGVNFAANCVINQQYSINATASSGSAAGLNFINIVGDPGQLIASAGLPQSTKVSQTFGLASVQLYDSCPSPNLHPLDTGYQVAFNLPPTNTQASASFPSSSNPYSITVATSNNDGTGTYTLNSGQIMADALTGSYPITATVNGFGNSPIMTSTLINTAGNVATVTPSTTSLTTTVNQPFAGPGTPLSVTVYDQFGNKVPGAVVIFDTPPLPVTTGATATFTTTTTYSEMATTDANGLATATQLNASQIAGSYLLTITVGSLTQTINLTNVAGTPNKITPTTGSFSTTVKTPFSTIFGVQVQDVYGNAVPGVPVNYTIINNGSISGNFTPNPTDCTAGSSTSQSLTTDTSGNVTPQTLCANQKAGSYTLSISAGTVTITYNLTNTAQTTPASIVLNPVSQTSAVVNNTYPNVTLIVEDQYGNPIPNLPAGSVTLSTPSSNFNTVVTGVFPGNVNTFNTTTDSNGQVVVTTLRASHIAGSYTLAATAGAASLNVNLTNTADNTASQLQLIAISPTSFTVPILGHPSASIVLSLTDQFNNPVSGVSVQFTTPSTGASGTFANNPYTSDVNGYVTVPTTDYTANAIAGTYSMVAQAAPSTGPSVTFTVQNTAGSANSVNTTVSPTSIQLQVGTTFPNIVITVKDTVGNPVSGVSATLSASTTAGATAVIPTATWGTVSDATGKITITNFLQANTVAGGPYVLTINLGSFNKTINVTNTPGPATSIVPSPLPYTGTQLASGGNYGTLAAKVTDQYNNPVPGLGVLFTAPNTTTAASGLFGASNSAGATTNVSGIATTGMMTANAFPGEFLVTATLTNTLQTLPTDYDFINSASMTISSGNGQTILVGATSAGLQVKVTGQGGTGLNNIPVTFDTGSNTYATFGGTSTTTTLNTVGGGFAQAAVTAGNTYLGSYNVTATITIKPGLTVQRVFNVTNSATMAITAGDGVVNSPLLAGGQTDNLTIQLSGSGSTNAVGIPVTFVVSPAAAGTLSSGSANTDTSGNATVTLTTGNYIGAFTVVATVQGIPAITKTFHLTDSANISYNSGNTQTKLANGDSFSPFVVNVTGFGGGLLTGVPVTFAASGANLVVFTPVSGAVTSSAGLAQINAVTGSNIGIYNVTATFNDGVDTAQVVTFNLVNTLKLVATSGDNQTIAHNNNYPTTVSATFEDFNNAAYDPTGGASTIAVIFTAVDGTTTGSFRTGTTNNSPITVNTNSAVADIASIGYALRAPNSSAAGTFTVTATATVSGVALSVIYNETIT